MQPAARKKETPNRNTVFGPGRRPPAAQRTKHLALRLKTLSKRRSSLHSLGSGPGPKRQRGSGTACARVAATSRAHRTAACDHTRRVAAVMARRARASLLAQRADQITRNHVPLLSKFIKIHVAAWRHVRIRSRLDQQELSKKNGESLEASPRSIFMKRNTKDDSVFCERADELDSRNGRVAGQKSVQTMRSPEA